MALKRIMMRPQAGRPVALPTDPDFASVALLLHMDGANGSASFTDSSGNAHAVTANGGAQISTAQSKFGGSSADFDAVDSYLSVADDYQMAAEGGTALVIYDSTSSRWRII